MRKFMQKPLVALNKHLGLWKEAIHHASLLEMARQRVFAAGIIMCVSFVTIAGRLVDVMAIRTSKRNAIVALTDINPMPRADIYDRNGNILATHLVTASLYANPKVILNPTDAATKLSTLFPDVGYKTILKRLSSGKGFTWLIRHIPPRLQQAVNELGIPGVYLQKDFKRVHPYGPLPSHALGYCGIDNEGLSGIEKFFNKELTTSNQPIRLSLDIRIQHIVRDVLINAITEFNAVGANAMVMDIKTGELLAMVSLPDFDPNKISNLRETKAIFNRNTLGVYEPGSIFKIVNSTIALDSGTATPYTVYDASAPYKLGKFKICDFKGKERGLTVTEAFVYSSNIASIKMALQFGIKTQKDYFKRLGVMQPTHLEIPEVSSPLIPTTWKEPTLITASYGYGISITPLQTLSIVGTIVNDGIAVQPTLLFKSDEERAQLIQANAQTKRVISSKTSHMVREMLRLVATHGGSRKANVDGYEVMGKTGTVYQKEGRGYNKNMRTTSFVGAFPLSDPQYMVIVMLDDPKASKETYHYAAAGWNAAPTGGRLIEKIAPILGIHPIQEKTPIRYVHSLDGQPVTHDAVVMKTSHTRSE